jgi:uncharacterized protein YraI
MTSLSRKLLLGAGLLALSATAAAAVPAVVRGDLNLRSGPGTQYAVVGSLPGGATVEVGNCSGRWCTVAYEGEQGYAARSYLDLGAAAVPAVPAPGVDYGYVEPDDYGDDYYYGYGPGVTLGFGYWGDRGYGHRRHWRRHDGGRPPHWGGGRPGRVGGLPPPRDNTGGPQPRRPGGPNVGASAPPPVVSGGRAGGTVGAGAPAARPAAPVVSRPATSAPAAAVGRGGGAGPAPAVPR